MGTSKGDFGRGWAAKRARVLAEEGGTCHAPVHHATCRGIANSVDHIVPRARGGGHERANLRAVYSGCNSAMGGAISTHGKRHRVLGTKELPAARIGRFA